MIIALAFYCFAIFTRRVCLHVFLPAPQQICVFQLRSIMCNCRTLFSFHRSRALFKSHYLRHRPSTQPVFWFNIPQYGFGMHIWFFSHFFSSSEQTNSSRNIKVFCLENKVNESVNWWLPKSNIFCILFDKQSRMFLAQLNLKMRRFCTVCSEPIFTRNLYILRRETVLPTIYD